MKKNFLSLSSRSVEICFIPTNGNDVHHSRRTNTINQLWYSWFIGVCVLSSIHASRILSTSRKYTCIVYEPEISSREDNISSLEAFNHEEKFCLSFGWTSVFRFLTDKRWVVLISVKLESWIQLFKYSTIQVFNYSSFQLFNYSTIQSFNYSTIQVFNYSIIQLFNYSSIQVFNYSTIQVFNYSIIPLFKFSTIQLFRWR